MPVAKFTSAKKFLRELQLLQGIGYSGRWYFRGQADASWRLVPSLFRINVSDEQGFERDLMYFLRAQLVQKSSLPERLLADDDYILALAQHYGSPTRMLDWTLSPLTAAYFAASGSLRLGTGAPLAVFAIASISGVAGHAQHSKVVYPPSGANDNLAAQTGVLLKHDWSCRDYWRDEYEHLVESPAREVSLVVDSRFIRIELPAAKAGAVLSMLERLGVDGVRLIPGVAGFVAAAIDSTWRSGHAVTTLDSDDEDEEDEFGNFA